ncbi:MAG: Sec-independent protein translocase protein TatB [Proteobacteria bacterium]|jgi:sec-independent protein translocase protein TatB|nr:Sec-independent protein translocase protein TatB [Pseudomonadota bacterium]
MFDIGFWELAVIAVVALLVIGPDKLPGVARKGGLYLGRFRRFVGQVKSDIDRELRQEELKKALERDAGLDELKQILNTDRYDIEDEKKPDYQVKAVTDEELNHGDLADDDLSHTDLADDDRDHTDLAEADQPEDTGQPVSSSPADSNVKQDGK